MDVNVAPAPVLNRTENSRIQCFVVKRDVADGYAPFDDIRLSVLKGGSLSRIGNLYCEALNVSRIHSNGFDGFQDAPVTDYVHCIRSWRNAPVGEMALLVCFYVKPMRVALRGILNDIYGNALHAPAVLVRNRAFDDSSVP